MRLSAFSLELKLLLLNRDCLANYPFGIPFRIFGFAWLGFDI
jgi:hypothetical protein